MISVEITVKAQFYDIDAMRIVWHGNYVRFLEQARCALLDKIEFNYDEMSRSGYLWPIVDMRIKFIRPMRFGQEAKVLATIVEFENRLKIDYVITDATTGTIITKAHTIQVAVDAATQELCFETPTIFREKVNLKL